MSVASRRKVALLVLAMCLAPAAGIAAPIPGLFTTGVDGAGVGLPSNALDPHYQIINVPGLPQARVINPGHPAWIPNNATSRWIWETSTGSPTNVTRVFRTSFDLTGLDPLSAVIIGTWATDNSGSVFLNGAFTGVTCGGFAAYCGLSISAGFVAGINDLDFHVTDAGVISGFRVGSIAGTADPLGVPEPGSLALCALGLAALGALRRRQARP